MAKVHWTPEGWRCEKQKEHLYRAKWMDYRSPSIQLLTMVTSERMPLLGELRDDHNFWIEGYSGDCVAIIYVFEPISTDIEEVYFKIGKYAKPKANIRVFSIEELRDNQALFEYKERQIVK